MRVLRTSTGVSAACVSELQMPPAYCMSHSPPRVCNCFTRWGWLQLAGSPAAPRRETWWVREVTLRWLAQAAPQFAAPKNWNPAAARDLTGTPLEALLACLAATAEVFPALAANVAKNDSPLE